MDRSRWSSPSLGVLALLCGCSGPTSTDAGVRSDGVCVANGATVILGNGADGTLQHFTPLSAGPPTNVYLIAGPQGGQHIWIGLRATGINPLQPRVQLLAFRVTDNVMIGLTRVRLPMVPAPENPSEFGLPSQQLFIDDDQYCSVMPGDVRVVMDFDDMAGHCLHEEALVHVTGFDPGGNPTDTAARVTCCTAHEPRCFPTSQDSGVGVTVDASGVDASGMDTPTVDATGTDAAPVDLGPSDIGRDTETVDGGTLSVDGGTPSGDGGTLLGDAGRDGGMDP